VIENRSFFETCKGSLFHLLFQKYTSAQPSTLGIKLSVFLFSSLVFAVLPTLIVICSEAELMFAGAGLRLSYSGDWNVLFMFSITLPLIITLLFTERQFVPACIKKIVTTGVVEIDEEHWETLVSHWQTAYRDANVVSQFLGVAVGVVVSYYNYVVISKDGFLGWQLTNGSLNPSGWVYLLFQLPFFYYFAVFYFGRAVTTVAFLNDFSGQARVNLQVLHPDNAGGLGPIGEIGLRNQYVIAAGGVNLGFFLVIMNNLTRDPVLGNLFVAALMFYFVGGPLGFFGPLIPFRRSMKRQKERALGRIASRISQRYAMVMAAIEERGISRTDDQELSRLKDLSALVSRMPVWPFDVVTMKRFLTAYIAPVVVLLSPGLVNAPLGKILGTISSFVGR